MLFSLRNASVGHVGQFSSEFETAINPLVSPTCSTRKFGFVYESARRLWMVKLTGLTLTLTLTLFLCTYVCVFFFFFKWSKKEQSSKN